MERSAHSLCRTSARPYEVLGALPPLLVDVAKIVHTTHQLAEETLKKIPSTRK
jgi:hypothetical protein